MYVTQRPQAQHTLLLPVCTHVICARILENSWLGVSEPLPRVVATDVHCCYETSGGGTEIIPAVHTATGAARESRMRSGGAAAAAAGLDGDGEAARGEAAAPRRVRRPAAPEAPDDASLTLPDSSSSAAQLKLEMQAFGVIYTDFQSCASFLKTELNPSDIKATSAMMQGFDFHPDEWQQYSNYQAVFADNPAASGRNQALIAHDDKFAMVLTRWDAEHTGPGHRGGRGGPVEAGV